MKFTDSVKSTRDARFYDLMKNHSEKGFLLMETDVPVDTKYVPDSDDALKYLLGQLTVADHNDKAFALLRMSEEKQKVIADSVLSHQVELDISKLRPFFVENSYSGLVEFSTKKGVDFKLNVESFTIHDDGLFSGIVLFLDDPTQHEQYLKEVLRRDQLLSATARVNHTLLSEDSIEHGVFNALDIIGKATGVDRVYVFENYIDPESGKYFCNQRIEWTKDSVTPQIDNVELQDFPMSDLTPRWVSLMLRGESVNGLVKSFPQSERDILEPQDIISILAVPVIIKEGFWGFVGFDMCSKEYEWSETEVGVLTSLASNIGLAYERIKTKDELLESRKKLEEGLQAEKDLNELKDRFISMISHEIRTPITAIVSSIDLIQSYGERLTQDKKTNINDRMMSASHKIIDLLEEVLLMGKANAGKMQAEYAEVDMKSFINSILQVHKEGSLKDHTVELNVELKQEYIYSDERLLSHILNNLLSNAGKYSDTNSTVYVSVTENEHNLTLVVKDHGIGISKREHSKIFEPFYRAREVFEVMGTGLGLSIAKGSAEAMKGTIEVESDKAQGSVFTVTIPLNEQ